MIRGSVFDVNNRVTIVDLQNSAALANDSTLSWSLIVTVAAFR